MKQRCGWAMGSELEMAYHDQEWGVPQYDDRILFEFLILEGAQAGLSWSTVLKKREAYRQAFDQFLPEKVAHFSDHKVQQLLKNPDIIRNRLKITSAVKNARAVLKIQQDFGSLSQYLWSFVDGTPIQNTWKNIKEVPAQTALSQKLSTGLKQRGCSFVGPTIMYAFMQAVGMVNDHLIDCYRYAEIQSITR